MLAISAIFSFVLFFSPRCLLFLLYFFLARCLLFLQFCYCAIFNVTQMLAISAILLLFNLTQMLAISAILLFCYSISPQMLAISAISLLLVSSRCLLFLLIFFCYFVIFSFHHPDACYCCYYAVFNRTQMLAISAILLFCYF